jgi:LysR family glycine cleavage system transcriptional activator
MVFFAIMSVPLLKLPPLDFLRGFVAVGRRMSVTLAADDLCLTQSAVSRQIHALEDVLRVKLLTRGYRSIGLTDEGEKLFRIADAALQQVQDVCGALTSSLEQRPVTITTSIGVAGLWLLPRLGRFQSRHPHVDVRVAANSKVLDLRTETVDLAIRYCPKESAPPGSQKLFGEQLLAVAHPSLKLRKMAPGDAIERNVLLDFEHPNHPWLGWPDRLASMGLESVAPKAVLRFNQYDQVIQAAAGAQGIALGRLTLVRPMLDDGRLVDLAWWPRKEEGHGYWLISAEDRPRPGVLAFRNWLLAEAELGTDAVDAPSSRNHALESA